MRTVAMRFTSRPREREARVAVVGAEVAVVRVGRRVVLRALARRARAAAGGPGLGPVELVVDRLRGEQAAGLVVREGERVEDRLDAREVTVRVVVGGPLAEVVEPPGELGRVGADVLEHGLALAERLGRVLERGAGHALELRKLA